MAIYEPPNFRPAFTEWIIGNGLLHEPMRVVDVGCQGGLQWRWKWLGEMFEAFAFDPLPEVIDALKAVNAAPARIHYSAVGLGARDGDRPFMRRDNSQGSYFLPESLSEAELPHDAEGRLTGGWATAPVRKLDTLIPQGGSIDHIKLDCEGLEIDALLGAEHILKTNGVFAVECESNLKLNPQHTPCHLVDLYRLLGPLGFDLYDLYYYRDTRAPFAGGYPRRGRPDTFDLLFLRGAGESEDLSSRSVDHLIKMAIIGELYALQDVAASIVARAAERLATRLDTEKAIALLRESYEACPAEGL